MRNDGDDSNIVSVLQIAIGTRSRVLFCFSITALLQFQLGLLWSVNYWVQDNQINTDAF